jgi:hypothetical protein
MHSCGLFLASTIYVFLPVLILPCTHLKSGEDPLIRAPKELRESQLISSRQRISHHYIDLSLLIFILHLHCRSRQIAIKEVPASS